MIRLGPLRFDHEGFPSDSPVPFLKKEAAKRLRITPDAIASVTLRRHSLDARKKPRLFDVYTVDLTLAKGNEEAVLRRARCKEASRVKRVHYRFPYRLSAPDEEMLRPVIAGFGPAGIFCAYELARHGFSPIVVERGASVGERKKDVEAFWETGALNPLSNAQFGEGGAGTFSDGKLNTGIKDREGRMDEVLSTFVRMGAPEDILYESHPHIGTDLLCGVVQNLREEIIALGGEVRFLTQLTSLKNGDDGTLSCGLIDHKDGTSGTILTNALVLATGHSARDTYRMLLEESVAMEQKAFAVGLRAQHPQALIDLAQYGTADDDTLPPSPYKLTAKAASGRGVYSFCMCPGGEVINASSEEGRLVVNGMSRRARASGYANSAIVVTITPDDYGREDILDGMRFQERLEEAAYLTGNGAIPVERYADFRNAVKEDTKTPAITSPSPLTRGAYTFAPVHSILPDDINLDIIEGMEQFGRKIKGFDGEDALLLGVETRTSAPVRILRDKDARSLSHPALFPCGEGAGYAGGIISAAVDGIKTAEAVARMLTGSCSPPLT